MPERRERDLIVLFTMTIVIQSSVFALALQWGGKWAEYAPFVFLGILNRGSGSPVYGVSMAAGTKTPEKAKPNIALLGAGNNSPD